jgi:hypothetical protein
VWTGLAINGPINLGLYDNEPLAKAAIDVWVAAGARPDRGLPPGIMPKWVYQNDDGTFGAYCRFAGREIKVRSRPDAGEAFRACYEKVRRIRDEDGPLPPGVVVRCDGYAVRYWSRGAILVQYGPFKSPGEARAAMIEHLGLQKTGSPNCQDELAEPRAATTLRSSLASCET